MNGNSILRLIAGCALFISAAPAYAEVADKEPTLLTLFASALGLNAAALLFEIIRRRLGMVIVPLRAFFAWGTIDELRDPYVGPAILHELGQTYVSFAYLSAGMAVLGPSIIVLMSTRLVADRKSRHGSQSRDVDRVR